MTDSYVFDPRDHRYKTPFGAAACSTEVSFTLRPLRREGFVSAELLYHCEFAAQDGSIALSPLGDGGDLFCGTLSVPEEPDLLWYGFRFTRRDGSSVCFGRNGYCHEADLQRWQLTVYDGKSKTPQWFGAGITYQIFPDRFCRSRIPDPTDMVGDRIVHTDWSDAPFYRPEANGEVTNRDFFGGDLPGIISKLDYLQSLGVTTLYLNPIFESASNHRYDTADYRAIDPMLGTEDDFRRLCAEAAKRGIHVMLDGVFNHTGSNSRYFNAKDFYPQLGAAQSPMSLYSPWYHFHHWPDSYESWWGIHTLPAVNEHDPSYREFIITGEDSVVRHWLRCGAAAWRLDVADELPDDFIADIRRVMTEEKPDSFLLGEVWEDGSNKIAYSQRRRYLLGSETHGLMNYPFRNAALDWLRGGDAANFKETMETLRENYPPAAYYSAMNSLSTHDTPRILTLLGAMQPPEDKDDRAAYRLSPAERFLALQRLKLAAALLYSFPGSPTIYYGDEVGMEGFEDPFNRGTYPWGQENQKLLRYYRTLGDLRTTRRSLQWGDIAYLYAQDGGLVLSRQYGDEVTVTALNASTEPLELTLPWESDLATDALTSQQFFVRDQLLHLCLPPLSALILI